MNKRQLPPDRVSSYFRAESGVLAVITVTGLLYNIGLVAGPWFEGQMTETLARILLGAGSFSTMVSLAAGYIAVIAAVQGLRFLKRFYVRRFANKVNRRMKRVLYGALVRSDREDLEREGAGTVLTKAISDVDDCAEGMRKFTTEVFDTGVALAAYAGMLLWYDWRLALLSMAFLPGSYALAERMKRPVQRTGAAFKEQAGALNAATMDRAVNALTYRVFGREEERRAAYEEHLTAYEHAAVKANLWTASLPPLYRVLSMIGAALILYFGGKNVLGTGWTVWSIAEFTTFLACFTKLATKSSKAAKLFNAVQKAEVSWKRIKPLMKQPEQLEPLQVPQAADVTLKDLAFAYGDVPIFSGLNLTAHPGDIIGITGPVACGKSTLGRVFLCEAPYQGSVCFGGRELSALTPRQIAATVGYLGHDPELSADTVQNNVLCGSEQDAMPYLAAVALKDEVLAMEAGPDTVIGSGGKTINGIIAQTGVKIDIEDDGSIFIASEDIEACRAARKTIEDIVFEPEVGALYYGKVVRIIPIGAFIELAPGKDGMCHIKDLEFKRTEKVEDVLNVGDMTWVKVTEIDDRGRVNLSRKEALKERGEA